MPMGGVELLAILAIILLFFGARRVPELARSLGKAKHEVHKGIEEAEAEEKEREKAEAPKNEDKSPPPEAVHSNDGRVSEEEKPKAGPTSQA
jgi:sec-independent protein translocase protein TatA